MFTSIDTIRNLTLKQEKFETRLSATRKIPQKATYVKSNSYVMFI